MGAIGYLTVGLFTGAVAFGLKRTPFLQARGRARIVEPDVNGVLWGLSLLAGLLLATGLGSYGVIRGDVLLLVIAIVTLLLALMLSLVGKNYLSWRPSALPFSFLIPGLFPAVTKAAVWWAGSGAASAGVIISVPLGIVAASWLVNRFEASGDLGMAAVALASLGATAVVGGKAEAFIVLLAGFCALVPALVYGFFQPAKAALGDIGTFGLGLLLALAAVLGDLALPTLIVFIPYLVNAGLGVLSFSLGEYIMRVVGGKPRRGALLLLAIQAAFGLLAVVSRVG
ncbi:MAG: hypothetical protein QXI12_04265 [Candidatus Methanomethyliaceae archaeon]